MASQEHIAPTPHRTVLVVAGGDKVLERARRYAHPGDRVVVLGAAHVRPAAVLTEGAQADPSDVLRRRADVANASAILAEHGVEADSVFVEGDAAAAVLRAIEEYGADLVIVEYERHGVLEHLLLGAVSDRIAHRAHCDVLVVH